MVDRIKCGLGYLRQGDVLTLISAVDLNEEEHARLLEAVKGIHAANESPLLSILETALNSVESDLFTAESLHQEGPLDEALGHAYNAKLRLEVFAAISAVYSFQENVEAAARRLELAGAFEAVNDMFRDAYSQHPGYLTMLKLRRFTTHSQIPPIGITFNSSLLANGQSCSRATARLDREWALQRLNHSSADWLRSLPEDPDWTALMREAYIGAKQVHGESIQVLNPRLNEHLDVLKPHRLVLLNPSYPVALHKLSWIDGRSGPMDFREVDAQQLINTGMHTLTPEELAESHEWIGSLLQA